MYHRAVSELDDNPDYLGLNAEWYKVPHENITE